MPEIIDSELSEAKVSSGIYRYDTIVWILSYIKIIRLYIDTIVMP